MTRTIAGPIVFTSRLATSLLAAGQPADAESIALTFAGGTTVSSDFTRGWEFSTSVAITITSLEWWDQGGDGLADTHQVAIWATGGAELVSDTVAAGAADPLVGGFRFDSGLSGAVTLAAGTYIIVGLSTIDDLDPFRVPAADLTLAPGITFLQNASNGAGGFSCPTTSRRASTTASSAPRSASIPQSSPSPPRSSSAASPRLPCWPWLVLAERPASSDPHRTPQITAR